MPWVCCHFFLSPAILPLRLFRAVDLARRFAFLPGLRLGWRLFIRCFWPGCSGFLALIRFLRSLRPRSSIFFSRRLPAFPFSGSDGASAGLVLPPEPRGSGLFSPTRY